MQTKTALRGRFLLGVVIHPCSNSDVLHIANTMWQRGREELSCLGISPEEWFYGWHRRIQKGNAVAFGPHAILGWDFESPDVVNTSFQASTSFEEPGIGKQVTKEMRKAIPELMKARGVRLFNTYSLCVDPHAPKWFQLLGMDEDMTYRGIKRGPYVTRRFIRRA